MHKRITTAQYTPDLEALARKQRVCAYARVSSDRDEAFHSLSTQISYYQKKIAEHPDWEFVEVFSDRGITGTKEDRPGFQAMLIACREHRVDIVLAKSITRFARNTVILLDTVRELRSLGIDIHFEEEHIETLSEKGEFMISILAARAQEESRQASENQKWRIQKSYEKGIPVTGNCLGYRMVDHQFLINEEEEQIVLRIFSMYLSGMGVTAIAKKLTEAGVKTRFGRNSWSISEIGRILENEKYKGDLQLQKTYTSDHIDKTIIKNRGERPSYYVKDAHDAIIDSETFERVQKERKRRVEEYGRDKTGKTYLFTGLIRCGQCGSHYVRKTTWRKTKYQNPVWICRKHNTFGKDYCNSRFIPEDILTQKTCEVLQVSELDMATLHRLLQKIIIPEKNVLIFVFKDGTEKRIEWQHPSRRESWTPEMKEAARQRAILYHKERRENKNA